MLEPFPNEDARFVFIQPLRQLPNKVDTAMREVWANWVRSHLPQLDVEVLEILGAIAALRQPVGQILSLRREANQCCAVLPEGGDDIEHALRLCARIREEWFSLAGEGIPQEVMTFLRDAGSPSGAAYSLLTAGVMEWLNQHGLKQALRVRMG